MAEIYFQAVMIAVFNIQNISWLATERFVVIKKPWLICFVNFVKHDRSHDTHLKTSTLQNHYFLTFIFK